MRKVLFTAMVVAGLCLAAGLPAFGQLNDITRSGLDLTPEDWELMETAALKLYLIEEAPVGTVETWSNQESGNRSEEHTSELQSIMRNSYAVFCLKKKNNQHI